MDTTKPNWWRKLTDCDPISLEPLRRLRVPPFNLVTDEQQRACWFDGKLLANYLVSSGPCALLTFVWFRGRLGRDLE